MIKECIICGFTKEFVRNIPGDYKCQKCMQRAFREKNKEHLNKLDRERKRLNPQSKRIVRLSKASLEKIIHFVSTIEKQKGWATTEQIFVEMITLYYEVPKNKKEAVSLDSLPTNQQLSHMWNKLKMVSSGTLSHTD